MSDTRLLEATSAVEATTDVLVVGAGPVGVVCALLLARRGWQVTVLERWASPYHQPRVHFDDEVARLLADTGIGGLLSRLTEPADVYEWRNGDNQTLLRFDWARAGPSGWPVASMVPQPDLEDALTDAAVAIPGITLRRGHHAVEVRDAGDHVDVVARDGAGEQHRFRASWLVGCDGANSFVRSCMATEMTDLGFFYDWLTVTSSPTSRADGIP